MTIKVTYNITDVYVTQDVSPVYINVSYSGGGSGAAVWGGITGTLSNQTDLQNALNAKFNNPTGTTSQYLRGDGTLATFPAIPSGTVTSVGLTMPSAFSVANSPVTSSGTLAVTGAGTSAQYIRGDGQLANFPDNGGGGSAYNYYLNGSVNQGTFGGDVYYEMSKTPVLGAGTNFTRTNAQGNGYIASFITDAGDPSLLNIPGGNWNLEFYFQSSSTGGSPQFYAELYKVSSSNVFTLIASGSTNPEGITNGTTIDQYFTSIPVPQTSLLVTDRLAVRIYVIPAGRTITLHTENSNLCEILTTFSTGLNALNGLTAQVQYFATGTSGSDFGISSATDTHIFNLPTASSINRGALSSADWTTFSGKVGGSGASGQVAYWTGTSAQSGSNNLFWDNANGRLGIGTNAPAYKLDITTNVNSGTEAFRVTNTNTGTAAVAGIAVQASSAYGSLFATSSGYTTSGVLQANRIGFYTTNAFAIAVGSGDFILGTGGGFVERFRLFGSTGNVLIQNGGTFTDSGERLQVTGDVKIVGSGATSGTRALTVQNSSSLNVFRVYNNGYIRLGNTNSSPLLFPQTNTGTGEDLAGTNLSFYSYTGSQSASSGRFFFGGENLVQTTGANYNIYSRGAFFPTSGTATFADIIINSQINQTGGANGITRGLYVNPTLTAAADFRAIETSAGGAYINTTSVNASAILQADSTTKGFLPPRMTTTQKNAISSPAAGLVVYDTTLNKLCVYTTAWETITSI